MKKTNAVRLLDQAGIAYRLADYEYDAADTAVDVANKIGLPPEQVFKTLVVEGDRHGVCFAVVPGDASLDLKALAKLRGERKVELVALARVQPLTGYLRGGVTALAAKKAFPVCVDETLELFDEVAVSAGVRGTQVVLAPADYLSATGGLIGPLAIDA